MDMQSDTAEVDIDLYADVMDNHLSMDFDESDLFDDVVTGASDASDGTSLNTSLTVMHTQDDKGNSTNNQKQPGISTATTTLANQYSQYRIIIANLAWFATDEDVTKALTDVGVHKEDIIEIKFFENRVNGQSRGYCYVNLRSMMALKFVMPLKLNKLHENTPTIMPYTKLVVVNLEALNRPKMRPPGYNQMGPNSFVPAAAQKPSVMNLPSAGNFREPANNGPRFQPRGPPPNNFRPPINTDNYNYRNSYPRGPTIRNDVTQNYPPSYQSGPIMPFCQGPPPPPAYYRGPRPMMPRPPPCDWNGPMIHNNYQARDQPTSSMPPRNLQPYMPNDYNDVNRPPPMVEPSTPMSLTAHVNPAFFSPGPPGVLNSPSSTDSPRAGSVLPNVKEENKDRSLHSIRRILSINGVSGLTQEEYEHILSRNRIVSSSAIARAVNDAANGDYAGAIETLNTASSLIRQSRVGQDDRCQVIINTIHETLEGIEKKSYGGHRRKERRSLSRERNWSRKSRSCSRSRSPPRKRRSSERDYRRDHSSRSRSVYPRDRSRERSRDREQRNREKERERRPYNRRFSERTDFRDHDGLKIAKLMD